MKYTEDVLREAVRGARSMADVLRHLGLPLNGGAHAHLRRRIDAIGIDTSHFLGRAHQRGRVSRRRRTPEEILVRRAVGARRAHPDMLRRALVETGAAYRCAACGTGGEWQGNPLTLHVDHVNGDSADCRRENLRFLCPNCHSQTGTYAGRNRRIFAPAVPVPPGTTRFRLADTGAVTDVLTRVDRGELTVTAAARLIGCHRNHVYRPRRRLRDEGTMAPTARRRPRAEEHADRVIAHALAHPDLGPKSIARELRDQGCPVAHGTISTILRRAGLATIRDRRRAAASVSGGTEHPFPPGSP
ncbi:MULTISPECIES: HNH endonuclease [Catenuloplanes]|uniref:Transposase/5-methylcytosine-specific restriction endonuclease McrA n=1 Tax=Catenuloplanes niger TaxID=587534 RepID=A0AAE3ZN58_9ACTN|nr:HNH endonuclease [Catenuloplanes niger]MDR7322276.1 transposase/5-methylcytosine-specific restriction endonuclease McrA [Catenuloplanes niger]